MPNIQILDQNTVNKIAAGEVIERPASVVKELLENAIDAKATAVTVEIREGGIGFIRVTDNGCGIPKDELSLAFLRHSTSKIRSVEDLFMISSLGFRGEALASIASVAQVEVITRTRDSLTASRYQIEGGNEKSLEEIGAPEGTTFIVRNLFFNTPVRRKFLKTAMTEAAHVADLVEKIALSHPEISFRFILNQQNKLFTSGNHSLKDIIYTIYGREITSNLIPLHRVYDAVTIGGFIGKPVITRSNRAFENYFINGRYIKSPLIGKALEEAYRPFMMQHKYPFTMLQLTIEPELLDVNVHPTKMELRFQDNETMFRLVRDAVTEGLKERELIPQVQLDEKEQKKEDREIRRLIQKTNAQRPEPFEKKRLERVIPEEPKKVISQPAETRNMPDRIRETSVPYSASGAKTLPVSEPKDCKNSPLPKPESSHQMDLFEEKLLEPKNRSRHRLIGQLFDTYWMVEFEDQLYIIDQHAAHEKVLYEQTMAAYQKREHTSQMLEPPVILSLDARQEALLRDHLKYFTDLGFQIESFGGREWAVRGVPDNLFALAEKPLLTEMLDELSEDTFSGNPSMICEKVASMSCKAAVKGKHKMSFAEADRLIDLLLDLENPYACPHGRPTIISMSRYELEKKFKRII
ncbi:MAG: DNA mismatch repair endonuclease MutL [Clostridiales bacterium]|nr:DNA mismatch repair endonuclease MutL [Clostridiales bacterium]